MQPITVRDRQTVLDIAMQEAGSLEAAIEIAEANGISITDDLATGQLLQATVLVNAEVVNSFYKQNRQPASAIPTDAALVDDDLSGIGFWVIGEDFIIT